MTMEKRVGFTLNERQIEQACEAFVANRVLADEEAKAALVVNDGNKVTCEIAVSKKRVRGPRNRTKNGE